MAKPKTIEPGKAYRLRRHFGRGPSDDVVLVTEVVAASKTTKQVRFFVLGQSDNEHLDALSYFRRYVFSEEPQAIQ